MLVPSLRALFLSLLITFSAAIANCDDKPVAKAKKNPLGDYVPCLFDDGQKYQLRAMAEPGQSPLNQTQAQTAASIAQASFLRAAPSGDTNKLAVNFVGSLGPEKFVNLLPSDVGTLVGQWASKAGIPQDVTAKALSQIEDKIGTQKFERPDDVSCSFSIMQRNETIDNFGRRVANNYVALQVTVRNLNEQNEFLIHDIQIAVDTGLDPQKFGRFQAARDKLIVRNVAQRGQTEDRRNVIINVLQAIGAIAGGASGALLQSTASTTAQATELGTAVSIFQGPFITGLINIFPDHTLEHLNHINDLTFSASSTSKTIVPTQGATPLVTFLAEKPLEQLPFSRCAGKKCTSCDINSPLSNSSVYEKSYPFKRWDACAIEILEQRTFVVISGVHIKETATEPALSSITCAPGNNTTFDLSQISGPSTSCSLKGNDLDLISDVVLESTTDATDQATGKPSITGGDNTQATVGFATKDLAALKGTTYRVLYFVKSATASQSTTLAVTVKPGFFLSTESIDFNHVNPGAVFDKPITLINNTNAPITVTAAITPVPPAVATTYTTQSANPCGAPIPSSGSCTFSVRFQAPAAAPPAPGTLSAKLKLTPSGSGNPMSIDLTAIVP